MTPYYETELGKLYHGDCLEIMPQLEPVDMILCDLPYGITACQWDTVIPFGLLWKEYKRLIIGNGAIVLTASQPFTSALVMSNIEMFKCEWIWEKTTPSNISAKTVPMKYHEEVIVFCKSTPIFNKQLEPRSETGRKRLMNRKSTIKFSSAKTNGGIVVKNEYPADRYNIYFKHPSSIQKFIVKKGNIHPTQKPVALFEYLIKTYTNEDDMVMDNCVGSGTTAIACERLKRKWIGIEIEEKYCEIAAKRIEQERKQLNLF